MVESYFCCHCVFPTDHFTKYVFLKVHYVSSGWLFDNIVILSVLPLILCVNIPSLQLISRRICVSK